MASTDRINAESIVVSGVATFLGNVTIGGTLTYEDVTDIDSVGIITANQGINITGGGINVVGVSTLQDLNITGNITSNVTIVSTDTGSSAAPEFKLYRNSASPDDGDYLGQIKFAGESDTGVERNYAKITGKISDASNGTEDGIIEIAHIKAGSQNISARFKSTELMLMNGTKLSVDGTSTFTGNILANSDSTVDIGTNSTRFANVYADTFHGAGTSLTGVSTNFVSAVGIQSGGTTIGAGITQLNFIGTGNTFAVNGTTIDISIQGGSTGAGGTENVSSNTTISGIITATEQFYPPTLTTSERDALTVNQGALIFNTTENKVQMYLGSEWKSLAFELDTYTAVGL